ncbi:hypothetical protein U6B65_14735 (plasmid) [Oscillospiraceae bacterium MB08-C2-2]|nr:hypothetical protein U6B65_14735 [Oscillospiraceae bacterium MB08-C2-2]
MTMLPTFLFLILFFIGVRLLLGDLYPVPSRAVRAAVSGYQKKPESSLNLRTLSASMVPKIMRFIRLGKYGRIKLANTLQSAHISDTPEEFLAKALAPAILFGAMTAPVALLVHPFIAVVFVALSVSMFLKERSKPTKAVKKKREEISMELPHFAGTISEELKRGRDVLAMLLGYNKVCGEQLRLELDVTLADMRTGNQREALGRLATRVGSLGLSQICRGLQSVLDGNDQRVYFQIISQTLENEQDQQTERYIQSLYNKIKPYSFLLLGCMVVILLTAVGIYIYNTSLK